MALELSEYDRSVSRAKTDEFRDEELEDIYERGARRFNVEVIQSREKRM